MKQSRTDSNYGNTLDKLRDDDTTAVFLVSKLPLGVFNTDKSISTFSSAYIHISTCDTSRKQLEIGVR